MWIAYLILIGLKDHSIAGSLAVGAPRYAPEAVSGLYHDEGFSAFRISDDFGRGNAFKGCFDSRQNLARLAHHIDAQSV